MLTAAQADAKEDDWRHGLSVYGNLKYEPDFKHFDYVDPNAPKGGSARQAAIGTLDNFNPVIAGVKGTVATGIDLIYDSLMVPALDEVLSAYGLLAESVSHPDDFSFVTYRLRAEAKFHDGVPVTPEDVIFSFDAFKKDNPQLSAYYQHV
jgi:microcin C transport system substrate-binding protein